MPETKLYDPLTFKPFNGSGANGIGTHPKAPNVSVCKQPLSTPASKLRFETVSIAGLIQTIRTQNTETAKALRNLCFTKAPAESQQAKELKAEYERGKAKLSWVTPCGVFADGRKNENLQAYSRMVCVDIDKLPVSGYAETVAFAERLYADRYVYAGFISPSGKGVKLFVRTDVDGNAYSEELEKAHKNAYTQVCDYFAENYDCGANIDRSGSDLARACFYSHDEDAYLNESATIFTVMPADEYAPFALETNAAAVKKAVTETPVFGNFEQWIDFLETNGIDITPTYDSWIRVCIALKVAFPPEKAKQYFHRISALYPNYNESECEKKFNACKPNGKITGGTLFFIAQKSGFALRAIKPAYQSAWFPVVLEHIKAGDAKAVAIKNIRIGADVDTDEQTITRYVESLYASYAWLLGAYEREKTGLKLKKLPLSLAKKFVLQHFAPRYSDIRGVEILINGKYEVCQTAHLNSVETLFSDLGIRNAQVEKAVYNTDVYTVYDPLTDFLESNAREYTPARAKECAETLISVWIKHGRIDTEKLPPEMFYLQVFLWSVLAVAQVYSDNNVNEYALVCVSQKQGTGKTTFCTVLQTPFKALGMVAEADYDEEREGLRKMKQNFILFDDELQNRTKKDIKAFKKCLSTQNIAFTDKYETQQRSFKRIASYMLCGNNCEFLKEESRRDYIIPFVESDVCDWKALRADCLNPELINGFWAFAYYEATNNLAFWESQISVVRKHTDTFNAQFKESSVESDLIAEHFTLPPLQSKQGDGYNGYKNLSTKEILLFLYSRLQVTNGGSAMRVDERKIKDALRGAGFKYELDRTNNKPQRGWRVLYARNSKNDQSETSDYVHPEHNTPF